MSQNVQKLSKNYTSAVNTLFNNTHKLDISMAAWLAYDNYYYPTKATQFSATSLLKSVRHNIMEKRYIFPQAFEKHTQPNLIVQQAFQQNHLLKPEQSIYDLSYAEIRHNLAKMGIIIENPDVQSRVASSVGNAIHSSIEKVWSHYNNYAPALQALGYTKEDIDRIVINKPIEEITETQVPIYVEKYSERDCVVNGTSYTISGTSDMIIEGKVIDHKSTTSWVYQNGINTRNYILQGSIYRWLNPDLITEDFITINFFIKDFVPYKATQEDYPPAPAFSKSYKLLSLEETEAFIKNKLKQIDSNWNQLEHLIPCCDIDQLFSTPPIFKYYLKGYSPKTRATKVFNTFDAASQYRNSKGNKGEIVEFRGKPFMCKHCIPEQVEQLLKHNVTSTMASQIVIG